jgi:hypothetical protein
MICFKNIIVAIASESGAHLQKKVFHLFPCQTWKQIDIVITKDNFWTLTNVIIANLTHTDLVQCALTTLAHATIVAVQNKARSYTEWTLGDDFIPLTIETYDCFHPHFDSFFTSCVHACIAHHQQTSLIPSIFISDYKQWVSIALQHVQAIMIVQPAVSLITILHPLPHIPTNAFLSLVNLWHRMPF